MAPASEKDQDGMDGWMMDGWMDKDSDNYYYMIACLGRDYRGSLGLQGICQHHSEHLDNK